MDAKEIERLNKKPFETMVAPIDPEVLKELRGWKPPKGAYVLFECRKYNVVKAEWFHSTGILYLEGRPAQGDKLKYFIEKGWRILHYGNFPALDNPRRRAEYIAHNQPNGLLNHWDEMLGAVQKYMNTSDVPKMKQTITDLEQRAAEAEKRAAELEKRLKDGKDGKNKADLDSGATATGETSDSAAAPTDSGSDVAEEKPARRQR